MKIINYLFAVLFCSLLFSSCGKVKDIAYLQGDDLFKRMDVSDSVEIKIRKNDILDISRLETGRLKFTYEKHDLIHLCRGILSTTACSRKEGVVYVFNPAVETFEIETDGQRLQQILINLLSNANKFTENGEIRLDLKIDEPGNKVFFSVTDTGCGIPLEKQQVIFDRFAKLNEYAQGTGLGLAICRITVNMLGGEIWVDKDYTGGARFVFTHPIHRP